MTDFSKLFEDAEKAVSGIKNVKLRQIAFDNLVNHLLSENSVKSEKDENSDRHPKKKREKSESYTSTKTTNTKGNKEGPKAWLRELASEGFFEKPKSSSDIREELETHSHHLKATDLTLPLQALCHERLLRRKKVAPENGGKLVLHWVNW